MLNINRTFLEESQPMGTTWAIFCAFLIFSIIILLIRWIRGDKK